MSQEALVTRADIISMEQAKPRVIVVSKEEERCFLTAWKTDYLPHRKECRTGIKPPN